MTKDDVRDLVDAAESLPIEYRADIEFEAMESGKITDEAVQRRLLERLFRDAQAAEYGYSQKDVVQIPFTRHRQVARAQAVLRLTALDIQTRAVHAMRRQSVSAAKEMFRAIELKIPTVSCESPIVYNVDEYYALAAELFGASEMRSGHLSRQGLQMLGDVIRRVKSPLQLAPAIRMLTALQLDRESLRELAFQIESVLKNVTFTDRELEAIEQRTLLTSSIEALMLKMTEQHLDAVALLQSFRDLLVRSTGTGACSDKTINRKDLATRFNRLIEDSKSRIAPLQEAELRAGSSAASVKVKFQALPKGDEFSPLMRSISKARSVATMKRPEVPTEPTSTMRDLVDEFVRRLEATRDDVGDCEPCVFHMKTEMYLFLLDSAPQGDGFEGAVHSYIKFLSRSNLQQAHPIEWLFSVKRLLNESRPATPEQLQRLLEIARKSGGFLGGLPSPGSEEIKMEVADSGDHILKSYLAEQKVLQLKYFSPYEAYSSPGALSIDP